MSRASRKPAGLERLPWLAPVLFGIYPVLHLYAANADRMPARYALLPTALSLAATALAYLVVRPLMRDGARAALTLVAILLVFWNYGRLRSALIAVGARAPALRPLGEHAVLWPLAIALIVVALVAIRRSRREFGGWIAPLGVFALALNVLAVVPLLGTSHQAALQPPVRLTPPPNRPDVYYIILDGYGRESVLRSFYGFDNRPFLGALERRGFVVPRHSRANYLYTAMSLASSLNMDDLDALRPAAEPTVERWLRSSQPLVDLLDTNRVARSFRAAGYRYVVLPSGLSFTNQSRIADVSFGPAYGLREFDSLLGGTTMLAPWFGDQLEQLTPSGLRELQRRLLECPSIPGPKFVFAHFLSPHPPYQFRADGSPAPRAAAGVRLAWGDHAAYVEQIRYLNGFVLKAVDAILKESRVPPIIVIQGDHGPALRDETDTQSSMEPWGAALWNARSGNLSAYLVPPAVRASVPDDVRPANAFRFVFDRVFGAGLPMRENRTYYSEKDHPYRFERVPESAMDGAAASADGPKAPRPRPRPARRSAVPPSPRRSRPARAR